MSNRQRRGRNIFIAVIISLAFIVLLSGCSSTRNPLGAAFNFDTDLRLLISAGADINPNQNSRSSPLVIRLYELKDIAAFQTADFVDLYERDEALLSGSLVGRHLLKAVVPGEERQERLVLTPGTTHVGLLAEFAQYRGSGYKVVFPVTQHNVVRDVVRVSLSGTEISLHQ